MYLTHHDPLGTPLYGRAEIGCNCYSSGEDKYAECILPRTYTEVLKYFDMVDANPTHEEVDMKIQKPGEEDTSRMVQWLRPEDDEEVTGRRKVSAQEVGVQEGNGGESDE